MNVPKETLNAMRGNLRKIVETYDDKIDFCEKEKEKVSMCLKMSEIGIEISEVYKRQIIAELNAKLGGHFKNNCSLKVIYVALEKISTVLKKDELTLELLASSIAATGFKNVTYRLPFVCFCSFGVSVEVFELLLSGIVMNAYYKNVEDEMIDELEESLLDYERKLSSYIYRDESGYSIKMSDVYAFSQLFFAYIDEVYKNPNYTFQQESDIDYESFSHFLVAAIINFVIYSATGYTVTDDELKYLLNLYLYAYDRCESREKSIKVICEETIPYYEDLQKQLVAKKEEEEKKRTTSKPKKVADYIINGHVVRVCDEECLTDLLLRERYKGNERPVYLKLMRGVHEFLVESHYNRRVAEYKKNLLTPREEELYETISFSSLSMMSGVTSIKRKIDEAIEFLVDEVYPLFREVENILEIEPFALDDSELYQKALENPQAKYYTETILEAVNMVSSDLHDLFKRLDASLKTGALDNKTVVVYYTELGTDECGEYYEIPRIYESILAADRKKYGQIRTALEFVLDGSEAGTQEFKKKTPLPLYAEGYDYKVFYTVLDGITIILDALPSEKDDYKEMIKLMNTPRFTEFISKLKNNLKRGTTTEEFYTNIIFNELEKVKDKSY